MSNLTEFKKLQNVILHTFCNGGYKRLPIATVQTKVVNCNNAYKSCHLLCLHTKAIAALTQFCDFFVTRVIMCWRFITKLALSISVSTVNLRIWNIDIISSSQLQFTVPRIITCWRDSYDRLDGCNRNNWFLTQYIYHSNYVPQKWWRKVGR